MPDVIEQTKKGQIKRKGGIDESTGKQIIQILRPETEADIVLYNNTIEGTAVTNVKDALDKIATGIGVTGVKGNAETDYRTGNVNLTPANLGIALDTKASGDSASNKNRIEVGNDAINVVTTDTTQTIDSPKTFSAQVNFTTYDINFTSGPQLTILNGKFKSSTTGSHGLVLPDTSSLSSDKTFATTDDITTAINALDTSSNVAPAVVSGSGRSKKITFKDINETDGIIAAGSDITNAVTYTDSAIDVLLDEKVNRRTVGNEVYTHSGVTQGAISYDTAATGGYIVQRDSNGQVIVPLTPTDNSHAASKKYVDDKITQGVEYLGVVDDTTELYALDSSAGEGDWVRVGTQFIYSSETCHVGDILVCSAAKGSSTHATWDVIHTEVDTDTNTQYQAIVGASGTGYAGAIKLQSKEIGGSFADQDTIKFINGSSGKISITPNTTNKTLTIEHAAGSGASQASGFYKFSTDSTSHISGVTAVAKSDLTGLGVADASKTITGTGALGGGGDLTANRTITHNELNTSGAQGTAKV